MHPKVWIDYDESLKGFLLQGDTSSLYCDSSIRAFLNSRQTRPLESQVLLVPYAPEQVSSAYRIFKQLLDRAHIGICTNDSLSSTIQNAATAEKDFEHFAAKAKLIWEAGFELDEFQDFCTSLTSLCPNRKFYPLQLLAAYHLTFTQNACNFSVPGAGKTSVVYAAFAYLNSLPKDDPRHVNHILVAGPLSSFQAWTQEFTAIFGGKPKAQRIAGFLPKSERIAYLRGHNLDSSHTVLTLTSYQSVSTHSEEFSAFLNAESRDVMFVLDEAHYIKSLDGVWAESILALAGLANSRVVLTGTPAPNGYEDLSNLFRFVWPNRNVVGFHPTALRKMSQGRMPPSSIARLKTNISPFFVRIKKSHLKLPAPHHHAITVPMSVEQAHIYQMIESQFVTSTRQMSNDLSSEIVKAKLMRLRQAASNPSLLRKPLLPSDFTSHPGTYDVPSSLDILGAIDSFRPNDHLSKLQTLFKMMDEFLKKSRKILFWSYFVDNLSLLHNVMSDYFDEIFVISGETPVDVDDSLAERDLLTREAIIDRFLSSQGTSALVANPQAVGESISLHKECHVAVYFDRDFNAGRFIQSRDRIHRYGLPDDIETHYYYLMAENTVDQDIHQRLLAKEERLSELIDESDIPLLDIVDADQELRDDVRTVMSNYERRTLGV